MSLYEPTRSPSGATFQAGIPMGSREDEHAATHMVRGVVMAVYVYDDPQHPYAHRNPAAIYCDVLTYTQMRGGRSYLLRNCLVSYDHASLQGGTVARPRAATGTLTGQPLSAKTVRSPALLNGDHCIVGFLDELRIMPVIMRFLPPPLGDAGHGADIVGRRTRLRMVDGDPHFTKHHGTYYGVTDSGDFIADASGGNGGSLGPGGTELAVGGDAILRTNVTKGVKQQLVDPTGRAVLVEEMLSAVGKVIDFKALPGGLVIKGSAGPLLALAAGGIGAPPSITLGAGGAQLPSTTRLVGYLEQLVTWLATHTHTATGGTSPTTVPIQAPTLPHVTAASLGNKSLSVPDA